MTGGEVDVTYTAVDELPEGLPAMFVSRDGHLEVLMSRQASADDLAAAFGPMYRKLAECAMRLQPMRIAAAVVAPLTGLAAVVNAFHEQIAHFPLA